jgi:hypothetical protein
MTPELHFAEAATAVVITLLPQFWEFSFNKI